MTDLPRKREKAGKASRFLFTGAAVGASLAAVGAMSAASQVAEPAPTPTVIVQRVVIPQQMTQPEQLVEPQQATVPQSPPSTQTPVTQSGGS